MAARAADAPPAVSMREIAVDGATSPARHCTRIARITAGCTPSVRRLMASASRPARLLMLVRLGFDDDGSVASLLLGTTCARSTRICSTTHTGGSAWPRENLQA